MKRSLPRRSPLLAALALVFVTACGGPDSSGGEPPPPLDLDLTLDYRQLEESERTALTGLDAGERATLRLFKTQVLASGVNDGGIYFNVLNNPDGFSAAEVDLVRILYNNEMAAYGGVNGKGLDRLYSQVALKVTGDDIASRYSAVPAVFATGPVTLGNVLTGDNGLGSLDNAVLRLWSHDLLDNGEMDGSITKFTLLSPFALDAVDGSPGALDPREVKSLLAADLVSGTPDGTPLRSAFAAVLEAVYVGGPGISVVEVLAAEGLDQAEADALFDEWAKWRGYPR